MTQPICDARYEITVDGKPRSNRDTKTIAIQASEYLKSKNPNVEVTVRDLIGGGRKTAQLLLERFDADGLTRRVGDARVLRRTASGAVPNAGSSASR